MKVRIPPSPTGLLHIGTARTALYNYLFAKKNGGTFVYRIEDTDKERSKKEYEEDITQGLKKLGLNWDEGPFYQSERIEIYKKALKELLDNNDAYYCFCSKEDLEQMHRDQMAAKKPPRYAGGCNELDQKEGIKRVKKGEQAVIRLRLDPSVKVTWNDLVRGEITIHSSELDDFVIARRGGDPLYHLTVVVDDHDMEITHVIRGEDHISNTPKQILLFRALGWEPPEFAHLPLILNEDKSKLSKRKNKVSVDDYLNDGILPEALINYLALLGWNTSDEQEVFTIDELIEKFSLKSVHKGGAIFDMKRLEWMNGEHIKQQIAKDVDEFYQKLGWNSPDADLVKKMLKDPDFEGRFTKLTQIKEELSGFFEGVPNYPLDLLMREKFGITPEMLKKVLTRAKEVLDSLEWEKGDSDKTQTVSDALIAIVTELELKNGQVLWPIRVALSGLERSPNFATLAIYLGKEESIKRLKFALKLLK